MTTFSLRYTSPSSAILEDDDIDIFTFGFSSSLDVNTDNPALAYAITQADNIDTSNVALSAILHNSMIDEIIHDELNEPEILYESDGAATGPQYETLETMTGDHQLALVSSSFVSSSSSEDMISPDRLSQSDKLDEVSVDEKSSPVTSIASRKRSKESSDQPQEDTPGSGDGRRKKKKTTATSSQRQEKTALAKTLPPCRVCLEPASGFHYGVNTCEACKGFFRRALRQSASFRCRFNKDCDVTGPMRTICSYCRFQKCQALGMSKHAIKVGRYTHEVRTRNIQEVKSIKERKSQRNHHTPGRSQPATCRHCLHSNDLDLHTHCGSRETCYKSQRTPDQGGSDSQVSPCRSCCGGEDSRCCGIFGNQSSCCCCRLCDAAMPSVKDICSVSSARDGVHTCKICKTSGDSSITCRACSVQSDGDSVNDVCSKDAHSKQDQFQSRQQRQQQHYQHHNSQQQQLPQNLQRDKCSLQQNVTSVDAEAAGSSCCKECCCKCLHHHHHNNNNKCGIVRENNNKRNYDNNNSIDNTSNNNNNIKRKQDNNNNNNFNNHQMADNISNKNWFQGDGSDPSQDMSNASTSPNNSAVEKNNLCVHKDYTFSTQPKSSGSYKTPVCSELVQSNIKCPKLCSQSYSNPQHQALQTTQQSVHRNIELEGHGSLMDPLCAGSHDQLIQQTEPISHQPETSAGFNSVCAERQINSGKSTSEILSPSDTNVAEQSCNKTTASKTMLSDTIAGESTSPCNQSSLTPEAFPSPDHSFLTSGTSSSSNHSPTSLETSSAPSSSQSALILETPTSPDQSTSISEATTSLSSQSETVSNISSDEDEDIDLPALEAQLEATIQRTIIYNGDLHLQDHLELLERLQQIYAKRALTIDSCLKPDVQDQLDQIIVNLIHAHNKYVLVSTYFSHSYIMDRLNTYLEQYQKTMKSIGQLPDIPDEVYMSIYRETGIDADGRVNHFKVQSGYVEEYIKRLVKFAKTLPGFKNLSVDDQIELIKAVRMDFWFLGAYNGYNSDIDTAMMPNGRCYHRTYLRRLMCPEWVDMCFELSEQLKRQDIRPEELILVKALLFTMTDRCKVQNTGALEDMQKLLLACLNHLMDKLRPDRGSHAYTLGELISNLTRLRDLEMLGRRNRKRLALLDQLKQRPLLSEVILSSDE